MEHCTDEQAPASSITNRIRKTPCLSLYSLDGWYGKCTHFWQCISIFSRKNRWMHCAVCVCTRQGGCKQNAMCKAKEHLKSPRLLHNPQPGQKKATRRLGRPTVVLQHGPWMVAGRTTSSFWERINPFLFPMYLGRSNRYSLFPRVVLPPLPHFTIYSTGTYGNSLRDRMRNLATRTECHVSQDNHSVHTDYSSVVETLPHAAQLCKLWYAGRCVQTLTLFDMGHLGPFVDRYLFNEPTTFLQTPWLDHLWKSLFQGIGRGK